MAAGEDYGMALVGTRAQTWFGQEKFCRALGMGYVRPDPAVPGTRLQVRSLDRLWPCEVVADSPHDPTNARIRADG